MRVIRGEFSPWRTSAAPVRDVLPELDLPFRPVSDVCHHVSQDVVRAESVDECRESATNSIFSGGEDASSVLPEWARTVASADATPAPVVARLLRAAGCSRGDVIDLLMAVLAARQGRDVVLAPAVDRVVWCLALPHLYDPGMSAWVAEATRLLPK